MIGPLPAFTLCLYGGKITPGHLHIPHPPGLPVLFGYNKPVPLLTNDKLKMPLQQGFIQDTSVAPTIYHIDASPIKSLPQLIYASDNLGVLTIKIPCTTGVKSSI